MDNKTIQVVRIILAFSWLYHGLFPKLLAVAPMEQALTATIGLSAEHSYWLTKVAGVLEVIFGIVIFLLYRNRHVLIANMLALVMLAIFVAIQMPLMLVEAFNPVTTNLTMIGLSYVLLRASNVKSIKRNA